MSRTRQLVAWFALVVFGCLPEVMLWATSTEPSLSVLDNSPCFHPAGENLCLCSIRHGDDGSLILEFQDQVLNAWFQTDGDGEVRIWFDRKFIGDHDRAILYRLTATEVSPQPGMGIGFHPKGYIAAEVRGKLVTIEDLVTKVPSGLRGRSKE